MYTAVGRTESMYIRLVVHGAFDYCHSELKWSTESGVFLRLIVHLINTPGVIDINAKIY
jgi:hypothetical protein